MHKIYLILNVFIGITLWDKSKSNYSVVFLLILTSIIYYSFKLFFYDRN